MKTSPYFAADFWDFFCTLFGRLGLFITGSKAQTLATDEVQVLVLVGVAISCALVGTFLILKKMTMLANSLSHTILPGLVVSYLICRSLSNQADFSITSLPMSGLWLSAIVAALLTTFLTFILKDVFRLYEDASIGLVSTIMVAIGIVFVSIFTRSSHLGVEAVMGNVDALHMHDVYNVWTISLLNALCIFLFFNRWKLVSFDVEFALSQGVSLKVWHYFLMLLTSLTAVSAFRAVGILLVLSFLVGPSLTARLFVRRLPSVIFLALSIAAMTSLVSVALSRHVLSVYQIPLSTAGIASTLLGVIYFFSLSIKMLSTKIGVTRQTRRLALRSRVST